MKNLRVIPCCRNCGNGGSSATIVNCRKFGLQSIVDAICDDYYPPKTDVGKRLGLVRNTNKFRQAVYDKIEGMKVGDVLKSETNKLYILMDDWRLRFDTYIETKNHIWPQSIRRTTFSFNDAIMYQVWYFDHKNLKDFLTSELYTINENDEIELRKFVERTINDAHLERGKYGLENSC